MIITTIYTTTVNNIILRPIDRVITFYMHSNIISEDFILSSYQN